VNFELLGHFNKFWEPLLGLSNKHNSAQSHATLSSGSESGSNELIEGVILVGIREDDSVVLGGGIGLNTLSCGSGTSEDMPASLVSSNE
jgi:hypothetical protein